MLAVRKEKERGKRKFRATPQIKGDHKEKGEEDGFLPGRKKEKERKGSAAAGSFEKKNRRQVRGEKKKKKKGEEGWMRPPLP